MAWRACSRARAWPPGAAPIPRNRPCRTGRSCHRREPARSPRLRAGSVRSSRARSHDRWRSRSIRRAAHLVRIHPPTKDPGTDAFTPPGASAGGPGSRITSQSTPLHPQSAIAAAASPRNRRSPRPSPGLSPDPRDRIPGTISPKLVARSRNTSSPRGIVSCECRESSCDFKEMASRLRESFERGAQIRADCERASKEEPRC
jgi:hypothetical protein